MKTYDWIDMAQVVDEVDALLKLIGDAYQAEIEEKGEGTIAAGVQCLRWSTIKRLRCVTESLNQDSLALRAQVKRLGTAKRIPVVR